jgi:nitrate reductase NapE component
MEDKKDKDFYFIQKPKDKKQVKTIRTFMFLLCAIFILLLICLVGGLYLSSKNRSFVNAPIKTIDFDSHFPGCKLLDENCLDENCSDYLYCSDKKYKTCKVYDCKDSFGVGTEDAQGKVDFRKVMKPSTEKIMKKISDCQGDLQLVEKKCVDGKNEIRVKVGVSGSCLVSNFRVFYKDTGMRPSSFVSSGENEFLITSNGCNDLDKITAVGEGGINISEKQF